MANASFDYIVDKAEAGTDAGLTELQRRKGSPEVLKALLNARAAQAQFDADTSEAARKRSAFAEHQNALANMRASGELGTKLADLIQSMGGGGISGGAQDAFLGVPPDEPRQTTAEGTLMLYEQAKGEGYKGTIVDFMRETKGGSTKTEKPPFTPAQARTQVLNKAKQTQKELEAQRYEQITAADWQKLSPADRAKYQGPDIVNNPSKPYFRERPEIAFKLRDLQAYMKDDAALKRSADSLVATYSEPSGEPPPKEPMGPPAPPKQSGRMTSQQAYEELKKLKIPGIEDADPNDPELIEDLLYYQRMQGATKP